MVWGVNGHPFTAYPGVSAQQQLDLLAQLGAKQYRVNLTAGAPTDGLEQLLPLAAARGITILPIVAPSVSLQDDNPETIYAKSRDAAFALGQHFAGRIKVWELGNELENYAIIQPCEMRDDGTQYPCTWGAGGGTSTLDYFGARWKKVSAALRGMSDGLHAADPTALRAVGTAGWGHTAAFDRMTQDGVAWDISVWHYYGCDVDDGAVGLMQHVANFGKPIWITEFNCSSYQQGEDVQAAGLQRLMTKFRSLRTTLRVEAAFIYELLDEPYWSGYEAEMGIVRQARNAQGQWAVAGNKKAFGMVQSLIAAGK